MSVTHDNAAEDPQRIIAELRRQLREREAEREALLAEKGALTEALVRRNDNYRERIDHQSATIDVLRVMSASPDDPQPVFDLIAARARDLCGAYGVSVHEYDGTQIYLRAVTGVSGDEAVRAAYRALYPRPATRETPSGIAILDRRVVRVDDVPNNVSPDGTVKSVVVVPVMRGPVVIGAISMGGRERGGFSDAQVELLKTFAEQAAIAIGNAATYRALQTRTADLRESLEYQTAIADVLKIISRSAFDLDPVVHAIAETAARLCEADAALMTVREPAGYRVRAVVNTSPGYREYFIDRIMPVDSRMMTGRVVQARDIVHVPDVPRDPSFQIPLPGGQSINTMLGVPLLRDGAVIGTINLARERIRPFTDAQIALVRTFADQAVIAIENTRLMTEQREALERQTAMAEVLATINASPGNLEAVFDAILDKILRLARARFGYAQTFDGAAFQVVASRDVPRALLESDLSQRLVAEPGTSLGRLIHGEDIIQVADLADTDRYRAGSPSRVVLVDAGGARTVVWVPLRRGGTLLGVIVIYRTEVQEFSADDIALLRAFGAQAEIAMENARLLAEQVAALERQTAMAEVLATINANPGELAPVFDTILEKAHLLCGSTIGNLALYDGTQFRRVAFRGMSGTTSTQVAERRVLSELQESLVQGARFVHIADLDAPDAPRTESLIALREREGIRSFILVPLRREGAFVGYISADWTEPRPNVATEVALLENFAAQAVIAMENARLLGELRDRTAALAVRNTEFGERIEQQNATIDVLQVMSSSSADPQPVYDLIARRAREFCGADSGHVLEYDGALLHMRAYDGDAADRRTAYAAFPRPATRDSAAGRTVLNRDVAHIPDLAADTDYRPTHDVHTRAMLLVPMLRDGKPIGTVGIGRATPGPFTATQIELLKTFAEQAVIATSSAENHRALQARTDELARALTEQREALEQQTATAEVLQVINASPGNLAPVFDAMLEKAMRLCEAAFGSLYTYDGENFESAAHHGVPAAYAEHRRKNPPVARPGSGTRAVLETRRAFQILDLKSTENYLAGEQASRAMADLGEIRTLLSVPLLKDDAVVGMFQIYRQEVRAFSDKHIALLENFAAQAVIAIENARLLTEQREALERQTAMAEVLRVINTSAGNLTPVLESVLDQATALCDAPMGVFWLSDGSVFQPAAWRGVTPEFRDAIKAQSGVSTPGLRAVSAGAPFHHTLDVMDRNEYPTLTATGTAMVEMLGVRTALLVPVSVDGTLIGAIRLFRREVRAFSDRQIDLLRNFAAQSEIAIANARLITEQREALERQTAMAEVLGIINASPGNLTPVFEAILDKAMALCGVVCGELLTFDGTMFQAAVQRGMPAEYAALRAAEPINPRTQPIGAGFRRLFEGENLVHVVDLKDDDGYRNGVRGRRLLVDVAGARSGLVVSLRRNDRLLGTIGFFRPEVGRFDDRQVVLLQSFAAQAVIAMENARLLGELRERTAELAERNDAFAERIDHQAATIDVLKAMSASPGDPRPVFDLIVHRAAQVCGNPSVVFFEYEGGLLHWRARVGDHIFPSPAVREQFLSQYPMALHRGSVACRTILDGKIIHVRDVEADPDLSGMFRTLGTKSVLGVPVFQDGSPIAVIGLNGMEAGGFTDTQIALLQTFAEQAAIAIASAKTYRALQERTAALALRNSEYGERIEHQAATIDVLKAMAASPGDAQPVFQLIIDQARNFCGADLASLALVTDGLLELRTHSGFPSDVARSYEAAFPRPIADDTLLGRAVLAAQSTQMPDNAVDRSYASDMLSLTDRIGIRAHASVPLRRGGVVLGAIVMARSTPGLFSDAQMGLLETFAEQAVIAIGSVATYRALRERTEELARRQSELRVTFENMGDGVALFDGEPRLVAWNQKFQEIFNVPDDLLNEHRTYADYIRYLAARGDYGPDVDPDRQAMRFMETINVPHTNERVRPDGRVIEIRHNPIADGGFVMIFSDITERKRHENEIAAARDAAQEAARTIEAAFRELKIAQANLVQAEKMASLGQLTAGIAHEIKNPLNFVNNFAALSIDLLDELKEAAAPGFAALTEDQRVEINDLSAMVTTNLGKIVEHGKRADGIVRAMLEHSRGSSGERRQVDLNALVDEALNLAYHGARAQDQSFNITLERDFGAEIGPIELNPQDMTRVFLNIFTNGFYAANKRAKEGADPGFEPVLRVSTRAVNDAVEIRIRDNGTGIPPDILDKLFQPFFTTKPTGEGTGLGLSITYDIVTKAHGGTITVESEVGAFTEFVTSLPRHMFRDEVSEP